MALGLKYLVNLQYNRLYKYKLVVLPIIVPYLFISYSLMLLELHIIYFQYIVCVHISCEPGLRHFDLR